MNRDGIATTDMLLIFALVFATILGAVLLRFVAVWALRKIYRRLTKPEPRAMTDMELVRKCAEYHSKQP